MLAKAIRGGVGGRVNGKLGPYPELHIISKLRRIMDIPINKPS